MVPGKQKLKVLHIIDTLGVGGAEKLLVNVVNSMPQFKHYVVYLLEPSTLSDTFSPDTEVICLGFRRKRDYPGAILRLRKIIRREGITVIHAHLHASTLIARFAAPKNCRVISTLHSMPVKRGRISNFIYWMSRKLSYNPARHFIIGVSETVLQAFNKVMHFRGGYAVLPNFISDDFYGDHYKRLRDNKHIKLVAVGNLRGIKNHDYLLEALRLVPGNYSLDIYGEGSMRDKLQAKIDQYQLPVKLCGSHPDLSRVLPEYDAFILSSLSEGNPLSLMEAMAAGLPVFVSDIPVFRNLTGGDAVYFNLADPADLAHKLIMIANHQINIEQIAKVNFDKMHSQDFKTPHLKFLEGIYTQPLHTLAGFKQVASENQFVMSNAS